MSTTLHALYRFYADDGALLYVGITADPGARWKAHSKEKPWWHEVTSVAVQHYPNRAGVLEAERAAIIAEKPRYNVVHNRGRTRVPILKSRRPPTAGLPYDEAGNLWTVTTKNGYERTIPLYYHWEVSGTPMSDDWLPDEIDAHQLLGMWTRRYAKPIVNIYWSVQPVCETAPFQSTIPWADGRNFLSYFNWPQSAHTGEYVNFNRIPVLDLGWNDQAADKGGFFQEATGWRPSPLQGYVDLKQVFGAAGINISLPASEAM